MLENAVTVIKQIKEDVMTAWGTAPFSLTLSTSTVFLGVPRLPIEEDHAVIVLSDEGIARISTGPRARAETLIFDIMGAFEWVEDDDLLVIQVEAAQALGDILCPPKVDIGAGIPSPSPYAGFGRGMRVTRVTCPSPEQGDQHYKVIVQFMVTVDGSAE
jgi:hypothetical protein